MADLPPPEKLSKSATEAEKQVRKALMKERKRCQTAANNKKRKIGADRSEEEVGAVAALSIISHGKRAKSGLGADRSEEEIGAVASSATISMLWAVGIKQWFDSIEQQTNPENDFKYIITS